MKNAFNFQYQHFPSRESGVSTKKQELLEANCLEADSLHWAKLQAVGTQGTALALTSPRPAGLVYKD